MVEAEVINPDVFAGSSGSAAADTKIIVRGNVPRVKHIGHGMKAGEIVIEGFWWHACGL